MLLKNISESTAIAQKEANKVSVIVEAVSKQAAEINAVKEDAEHVGWAAWDTRPMRQPSVKSGPCRRLQLHHALVQSCVWAVAARALQRR